MKKTTILLGIAAVGTGVLVAKKVKAMREERSLRSLIADDLIERMPSSHLPYNRETLDRAKEKNQKPYTLPKRIRLLYKFKKLGKFTDTFDLIPKNYQAENIIFYLHGGAYWNQPQTFHFAFLNKLSKRLNARIIVPIYPKAPNYSAEDAHAMIMARYRYLVEVEKVDPKAITLMGDSSGAGLGLAFLQVLRDKKLPLPKRAILLSPWLDISNSNPAMEPLEQRDKMLSINSLRYQGRHYAGALDLFDPLVSPLYGDNSNLPPIHIFIGTHDILYPDALVLYEKALEKGWDISLDVYPKMPHIFALFPIPEGKQAMDTVVSLMNSIS